MFYKFVVLALAVGVGAAAVDAQKGELFTFDCSTGFVVVVVFKVFDEESSAWKVNCK